MSTGRIKTDNFAMYEGIGRIVMTEIPSISISHAGFHVFDMNKMVDFFTSVYGFQVTDRGHIEGRGEITFLGADPRDHHQLVLYEGRTKTNAVVHHNHISFRVDSLDRVRLGRGDLNELDVQAGSSTTPCRALPARPPSRPSRSRTGRSRPPSTRTGGGTAFPSTRP